MVIGELSIKYYSVFSMACFSQQFGENSLKQNGMRQAP